MTYANRRRGFDKHMKVLGHIISAWAELEHRINAAIWELANVEAKAGACMTAQMIGPGPRIRALVSLVLLRGGSGDLKKAVNAFGAEFESLGARRNRFAHDPFIIQPDRTMVRLYVSANKVLHYRYEPVPVGDLVRLFEDIGQVYLDFNDLWQRITEELPAWDRDQFEKSEGARHGVDIS